MQSDDPFSAVPRAVSEYEARTPRVDAMEKWILDDLRGQPPERLLESMNFYARCLTDLARSLERKAAMCDEALDVLRELVEAGDDIVSCNDYTAAMLRFGNADDRARALLALARQKGEGK